MWLWVVVRVLVDRPVRGQRNQRQQGDAEVAQGLEQAVQCGLVDDWSADDGGAVVLGGQVHAVEPGRPTRSEVSLDADLVPLGGHVISARLPVRWLVGVVVVAHEANVRTDLVSAHHMMW